MSGMFGGTGGSGMNGLFGGGDGGGMTGMFGSAYDDGMNGMFGGGGAGDMDGMFADMFAGLSGGGGGSRKQRSARGQKRARSGVTLSGIANVHDLEVESFKSSMEADAERRNVVVVFYDPKRDECQDLREALTEFGEKFAAAGLVDVASVNCARQKSLCQEEVGDDSSQPSILYFGPGIAGRKGKRHPSGPASYKSLSSWLPKVMPDYSTVLAELGAVRTWLASDDQVPHVIFFSERKTTPPLLKTLALEFKGRAALGVVLAGAEAEVSSRFGVRRRPALLHILDEESLENEPFQKDFKKEFLTRFLSRASAKHRSLSESALRELTPARLKAGDCAPSDSHFCVLLLRPGPGAEGKAAKDALRQLAQRLRKDPVKVFIVRQSDYARPFGSIGGSVVLYRPKRKRFKLFTGDVTNANDLATFVDSAVGGGAPLPELLQSTPSMREEL